MVFFFFFEKLYFLELYPILIVIMSIQKILNVHYYLLTNLESWSWKLFDPIDITRVKRQATQLRFVRVTYVPKLYKLSERTPFVRILGESAIFEKVVKSFWNFLTFSILTFVYLRFSRHTSSCLVSTLPKCVN